jgi:hypothetical protein
MFSRHLWTKILDAFYDKSKMSQDEKEKGGRASSRD